MAKTLRSLKKFDPADYLKSQSSIEAYLEEVFEIGNPALIADSIGVVARAKGMTAIAQETGLSRESLYRALSRSGNPELETLLVVLKAMGLRLTVEARKKVTAKRGAKAGTKPKRKAA